MRAISASKNATIPVCIVVFPPALLCKVGSKPRLGTHKFEADLDSRYTQLTKGQVLEIEGMRAETDAVYGEVLISVTLPEKDPAKTITDLLKKGWRFDKVACGKFHINW